MLSRVHDATPPAGALRRSRLDVPGRRELDEALQDLGGPWDGGALSEPARQVLARHIRVIADGLRRLDQVASERVDEGRAVVTHGEPHPGNVMDAGGRLVLVDWDTVALGPPERDLWMLADDDVVSEYRSLTGVELDRVLLDAYWLLWALADVAAFTVLLRAEHRRDADAERALAGLRSILEGREPDPFGTGAR